MKKNELIYKFMMQTKVYNKSSFLHNLKSDLKHFSTRQDFLAEQLKTNNVSIDDRKSMIKWLLMVS
jgi:hypothetical protein